MPTVITPLGLEKPIVGADKDTWGQYTNNNWDKVNAIFLDGGTGTSVGLHVGTGKVLKIDGGTSDTVLPGQLDTQTLKLRDAIDATKVADIKADLIPTGTIRTLHLPNGDGTLALQSDVKQYMPTGTILHGYYGNVPPTGFVFADGGTIGDASSGASNRANADTKALFSLLWAYNDATRFPLYNSDGSVVVTRGPDATTDFDAHRRITLPDHRGVVAAGRDDLGGTNRGILATVFGAFSIVRGYLGGSTTHALSVDEMPAHAHTPGTMNINPHGHAASGAGLVGNNLANGQNRAVGPGDGTNAGHFQDITVNVVSAPSMPVGGITDQTGSGLAHNNTQPTIIVDVVIAL